MEKENKPAEANYFADLNNIDVSKYVEIKEVTYTNKNSGHQTKIKLSYLSWAYAIAEIKKRDPQANWVFLDPLVYPDRTMMIQCNFTCFGVTHYMWLPVMNQRNQPIQGPNAFEINTAMMRCLVKAIAVHGLGLYLYAGEDLPEAEKDAAEEKRQQRQAQQNTQRQAQQNTQYAQQNNQNVQQHGEQKLRASNASQLTPEKQKASLQKSLNQIKKTKDANDLNASIAFFMGTEHEQTVRNACQAKADLMGW